MSELPETTQEIAPLQIVRSSRFVVNKFRDETGLLIGGRGWDYDVKISQVNIDQSATDILEHAIKTMLVRNGHRVVEWMDDEDSAVVIDRSKDDKGVRWFGGL
jgi:hypothetical protein